MGLDLSGFAAALEDGRAERAFRADMRRMRERGIRGFPSYELIVGDESAVLGGFLPFDRLEERVLRLAPGLEPRELPPVTAFVGAGELRSDPRGNSRFWMPAGVEEAVLRGTGELALDNTIMSNSLMVNEIQGEVRPWAPTTRDRRISGGRSTPT